jgi:hypothetical protein
LEFDQKNIFVKIPFERSISWFQNNKKTKKRHVSSKDEMWPQNKMRNDNSTIKWWTIQHHSWISFSGHICVLPSNFDHLLFWWCSGDKMIDDIISHKLSSILETRVCSTEMVQEPSMIFTSGLNYTTVVACKFIEVGATNLESNRCWSTNLSGRWMSILAKTFEQLMLWQGKMTEFSQLRVIFWFNSHHCYGIHGRSFNLSSLDS